MLCGGSRSRSYALTGDFLAEEPRCVYEPKGPHSSPRIGAMKSLPIARAPLQFVQLPCGFSTEVERQFEKPRLAFLPRGRWWVETVERLSLVVAYQEIRLARCQRLSSACVLRWMFDSQNLSRFQKLLSSPPFSESELHGACPKGESRSVSRRMKCFSWEGEEYAGIFLITFKAA